MQTLRESESVNDAQIATEMAEPDRSKPPCLICGAMTEKEAEVMCWCSEDDDCCHGQELWPELPRNTRVFNQFYRRK